LLEQVHLPLRRVLGIACAAASAAAPAASAAGPSGEADQLRAENAQLEAKARSAVLGLYALDSRLTAARSRVASLQAQTVRLRAQRDAVRKQLAVAKRGKASSEVRLASRLRQLYEQGELSPVEVVLGATSLTDALDELDGVERVASLNDDMIVQLRSAHTRLDAASRSLAARQARLESSISDTAGSANRLVQARAERQAYVASLRERRNLNAGQIAKLDAQARTAQTRSRQLTRSASAAVVAAPVAPRRGATVVSGRRLTVTITGYALPGKTATGIPVGWGVAAVDPRVIPLGTHLSVPGYGEAVAADVGGAVVGTRVDVWFPTVGQAQRWGERTLTIRLR
jgi:3D (Asp-Asp-Asp) domain-containing protein